MEPVTAGTARPTPELQLDVPRLREWMREKGAARIPGAEGMSLESVAACAHGQSNPTYVLELAGRSGGRERRRKVVLRKKPVGALLKSAHAIDREFQVISALRGRFPVPEVYVFESDGGVVGTSFYLMECVEGRLAKDPQLPGMEASDRRRVWLKLAENLAALHNVPWRSVGLESFARDPRGFSARVLRRWSAQYARTAVSRRGASGGPLPEMEELRSRLKTAEPMILEREGEPVIIHGDYRLDNVVFRSDSLEVAATLDWELATLGDCFSDLATLCSCFHLPAALSSLVMSEPPPPGTPNEWEIIDHYCRARAMPPPSKEQWAFYVGLSLYKLAAILDGVGQRASHGAGASPNAAEVGSIAMVSELAKQGIRVMAPFSLPRSPAPEGASGSSSLPPRASKDAAVSVRRSVALFVREEVMPAEPLLDAHAAGDERWKRVHPVMEELKRKAKAAGLWNLWITAELKGIVEAKLASFGGSVEGGLGHGFTNEEYVPIAAEMGRSVYASEVFNCSAPDTGNAEILARFGSEGHCRRWLVDILSGRTRSAFLMTERAVASSDATNICTRLSAARAASGEFEVTGAKWWSSGAMDPRCDLCLCLCLDERCDSQPRHRRHSIALFSVRDRGVRVVRPLHVFGFDDAPHGHAEVALDAVRVRREDVLGSSPGSGFEQAQSRLGPGRLHHCGRLIGGAERCLELAVARAGTRTAFGKKLVEHGSIREKLARSRIAIESARLLTLDAAKCLDERGVKEARGKLAIAKVAVPEAAQTVADHAIQIFGGAGVSSDVPIARLFAAARTLRIADGPDEVHLGTIAKIDIASATSGGAPRL